MANRYKVWKPGVSISDDTEAFDKKLEEEYNAGYKVICSFRDVIIFEKFSSARKTDQEIKDIVANKRKDIVVKKGEKVID